MARISSEPGRATLSSRIRSSSRAASVWRPGKTTLSRYAWVVTAKPGGTRSPSRRRDPRPIALPPTRARSSGVQASSGTTCLVTAKAPGRCRCPADADPSTSSSAQDRDKSDVGVDADSIARLDPLGRRTRSDHRWKAVLAAHDRSVRHDPADIRDGRLDQGKHRRPMWCRDRADQDLARTGPGPVVDAAMITRAGPSATPGEAAKPRSSFSAVASPTASHTSTMSVVIPQSITVTPRSCPPAAFRAPVGGGHRRSFARSACGPRSSASSRRVGSVAAQPVSMSYSAWTPRSGAGRRRPRIVEEPRLEDRPPRSRTLFQKIEWCQCST